MPNYIYTAKTVDGKTVKGEMVARNPLEVSQVLKDQELILINALSPGDKSKKNFSLPFLNGVPASEKIIMTRNLSVMVATGLSLVESFNVLVEQTKNKTLKNALIAVKGRINKGESLSSSLAVFPDIFSDFFRSMIQIGEESGTLDEALKILAVQLEKEHKVNSKIRGAMVYPAIVLILMLIVGVVLVQVVLPSLNQFFESLDAEIPFYTRMLIDFGKYSQKNWPVLLIAPVVIIALIWMGLRTKAGKRFKDTVFLKAPVLSSFVKKQNCAVLIRSLSSLMGSGVPLVKSLEVAGGTVPNFYFKKSLADTLDQIKKGKKMFEALSIYKDIFPYGAVEMMQVGEETGKTSAVLKTLADFYEDELIAATEKLTTAIEPVLIIALGLMVGFFAFSVIQPMYSSLQAIM